MTQPRPLSVVVSLLLAAAAVSCEKPKTFVPLVAGGPSGVIEGAVTYVGPPPCTQDGHVVGAAVLLGFDVRTLPPPDGLGTTAASIDAVSGDELFAGASPHFEPDGSLYCPEDDAPPITVSAPWVLSPLVAGTYQVRGFYDRDGDFDPVFSIAKLPTRGDVGGGAIENAAEVLAGKAPRYREITLGAPDANGALAIPDTGARVSGVAVTLGLTLPLERPVFHVSEFLKPTGGKGDPNNVIMPSDFELKTFSTADPDGTEQSFIRLRLAAGVPDAEVEAGARSPFFLPVGAGSTPTITYSRQDVNGDGQITADDHVPDSAQIPSLFPLAVFSKLADGSDLVSQSAPAVILQGLTIYNDLTSTALAPTTLNEAQPSALVALRPATLCLHPNEPERGGVLVVSRATDNLGNPIIADEDELAAALTKQFFPRRDGQADPDAGPKVEIAYGCLPEGRYAMNLLYGTGQAWTVPNEAGVCAPTEPASGTSCGTRARLASQSVVVTIGAPTDAAYCEMNPTPDLCKP